MDTAGGQPTAARRHFIALDGLRGVAALTVWASHAQQIAKAYPTLGSFGLSVDFFFMLSGFVVAYAYENRLRSRMNRVEFAEVRAIRLYPLYLMGSAIGLLALVLAAFNSDTAVFYLKWSAVRVVQALFLFPMSGHPTPWTLWPLNPPAWSLFMEAVVNVLFAIALVKFRTRHLALFTAFAFALAVVATLNPFPKPYGIVPFGLARACFGFCMGQCIYRIYEQGRLPKLPNVPFPILAGILVAVQAIPSDMPGALYCEIAVISVIFPTLLCLGLQAHDGRSKRVATVLGDLSYPLYVIHFPILMIAEQFSYRVGGTLWIFIAGAMVLTIPTVWWADRGFDRKIRTALSRWNKRRRSLIEAAPAL